MGFGKYKNANSADLLHRVDLYDFATGERAVLPDGRQQFVIVRGGKSLQWQSAIEREAARNKKKGKSADDFSFAVNARVLGNRLSEVVVAALVDIGDDVPDVIDFQDISKLMAQERNKVKGQLAGAFTEITDLAMYVHDEVVKDSNFLPDQGQNLSALLNSEPTTTQSPTAETEAA